MTEGEAAGAKAEGAWHIKGDEGGSVGVDDSSTAVQWLVQLY